jgi:hypothetical protein
MRQTLRISSLALCVGLWIVAASGCSGEDGTGPEATADTSATGEGEGDTAEGGTSEGEGSEDATGPGSDADGPAVPAEPSFDQCTGEESELIATANIDEMMGECTGLCMMSGATDLAACVSDCVADDTELSLDCAGCFGEMAECVMFNCDDLCPSDPEACSVCAGSACSKGLQTCMGVDSPPPPALLCMNPSDQQAIEAGAAEEMSSCLPACFSADDAGDCFGTCASDHGLTNDCSGCFADLGTCTIASCPDACSAETFDDVECITCFVANCEPAFQGCTGLDLWKDDAPTGDLGLCDGGDDTEALLAADALFDNCVASCSGTDAEPLCMNDCLFATGVSSECAGCLAPLQACLDAHCEVGCTVDSDDSACGQCMSDNCGTERDSCFAEECAICPPSAGLCMNDEDGLLMASLQQTIGECTGSCADDADPLACATQCLADAGLSADCSGCMAALAVCTMQQCGASCNPQAQAQDGGAACFACTELSCSAESSACFGTTGLSPGPGAGAACVNDEDSALLSSESDPKGVCDTACIEADDQPACVTTCLEQAGFSTPCSDCIGALSACTTQNCSESCNNDAADEVCQSCVDDQCGAEQAACHQGDGPGADPMCGGSADKGLLEANPDMMEACMGSCMMDPSTADACLTQCFMDVGLSDGCSGCVSWMLGCTLTKCSDVCTDPSTPDACGACAETQCAEETATCYGADGPGNTGPGGTGPGPGDPGTANEGLCSGLEDSSLMQSQPSLTSTCGQQCFAAEEQSICVGDCLFTNGLSEECAYCMGDLITCSMANCLAQCMAGGPECQTCTTEMCAEATAICYGGQP